MRHIPVVIVFLLLAGCGKSYLPKPKGYNFIDLPEASYQSLEDTMPYDFEYSKYARLYPDTSRLSEPYWMDIYYPVFDAFIQLTYKPVDKSTVLEEYITDSYRLTSKHNVKAYSIEEKILVLTSGKVASVSELEGDVPSTFQFYITDSTHHFLRGALYFHTATKNDSLAPAIDFLKNDIVHLLSTLEWRNP
ncbi:MAG: gliding motility lipoprotein GldD [Cyclobacteriaceae bacterium]|nr:gliding motility lipoprotein GldD [Cyclobacteriaceae bacterium]